MPMPELPLPAVPILGTLAVDAVVLRNGWALKRTLPHRSLCHHRNRDGNYRGRMSLAVLLAELFERILTAYR